MAELRWNPLLGTWTMVVPKRQNRPHLEKGACPFCIGSDKVPSEYDVLAYKNDFPALSQTPENVESDLFVAKEAYGKCEVILYSPDHNAKLYELSDEHLLKLALLWQERYEELSQDDKIKYIHIFENKGEEVGTTMHHPHGQLYAYSWLPLKLETELKNCQKKFKQTGSNLLVEMLDNELKDEKRIIFESKHFVAFIPYFSEYPFGVFIMAKDNITEINEMSEAILADMMLVLKKITKAFDKIYDRPFPYMMSMHQAPVNMDEYTNCKAYYRFHIEFYPPLRSADKIKWNAGSETGAWAAANPLSVEECAKTLRELIE